MGMSFISDYPYQMHISPLAISPPPKKLSHISEHKAFPSAGSMLLSSPRIPFTRTKKKAIDSLSRLSRRIYRVIISSTFHQTFEFEANGGNWQPPFRAAAGKGTHDFTIFEGQYISMKSTSKPQTVTPSDDVPKWVA